MCSLTIAGLCRFRAPACVRLVRLVSCVLQARRHRCGPPAAVMTSQQHHKGIPQAACQHSNACTGHDLVNRVVAQNHPGPRHANCEYCCQNHSGWKLQSCVCVISWRALCDCNLHVHDLLLSAHTLHPVCKPRHTFGRHAWQCNLRSQPSKAPSFTAQLRSSNLCRASLACLWPALGSKQDSFPSGAHEHTRAQ